MTRIASVCELEGDFLIAGRALDVFHGVYRQCGLLLFQFETELAQDREDCGKPAKAFAAAVAPDGGGGSRMGAQPSVFTVGTAQASAGGKMGLVLGEAGSRQWSAGRQDRQLLQNGSACVVAQIEGAHSGREAPRPISVMFE